MNENKQEKCGACRGFGRVKARRKSGSFAVGEWPREFVGSKDGVVCGRCHGKGVEPDQKHVKAFMHQIEVNLDYLAQKHRVGVRSGQIHLLAEAVATVMAGVGLCRADFNQYLVPEETEDS